MTGGADGRGYSVEDQRVGALGVHAGSGVLGTAATAAATVRH